MKKEVFERIKSVIETRIKECSTYLDNLGDLGNLTVREAGELQHFCIAEISRMDAYFKIDLYHILGMGKLTVTQWSTLNKLNNIYLGYRGRIKNIACNFKSFSQLPGDVGEATYVLKIADNIELSNVCSAKFISQAPVSIVNKDVSKCPFKYEEGQIVVNFDDVDSFINKQTVIALEPGTTSEDFMLKVMSKKKFCGVEWTRCPETRTYIGVPNSNVKQRLDKFFEVQ